MFQTTHVGVRNCPKDKNGENMYRKKNIVKQVHRMPALLYNSLFPGKRKEKKAPQKLPARKTGSDLQQNAAAALSVLRNQGGRNEEKVTKLMPQMTRVYSKKFEKKVFIKRMNGLKSQ